MKAYVVCLLIVISIAGWGSADESPSAAATKEKPEWAKKDIRDYSEADMERLLEQWDDNDEDDDEKEPKYPPPPPAIDFSSIDTSNPDSMIRATKKGRTLMMFVTVKSASREQTEEITSLWQGSLQNNHLVAQRFLVEDHRAIFMFNDGDHAFDAKDYLIQQPDCVDVTIEGKAYPGAGSPKKDAKTEL